MKNTQTKSSGPRPEIAMSDINEREYNENLRRAIKLTSKEIAMLAAILDDEFHDAEYDPFGHVWSWSPCASFGPSAGGIMASLSKKGLIIPADVPIPDYRTVALTISGFTTLHAYAVEKHARIDLHHLRRLRPTVAH